MNNVTNYTVQTSTGRIYSVDSALTNAEAVAAILASPTPSDFALSIATQAKTAGLTGRTLSSKQTAWLHILADWASKPATQVETAEDFSPLIDMLHRAANAQKRAPFINLEVDSQSILVRLNQQRTHANVTTSGPFERRLWFGRINADGSFVRGRVCTNDIVGLLRRVSADPAVVASQHGVATGYCCFCARDLSTKESRSVGYGPVCADKFGLPWGTIDPDLDAAGKEAVR